MVLLAFVILIVTLVGCAASLIGHPSEGIGVPVIAIGVFAFIYLLQPASILLSGEAQCFLDDKMLVKGLLLPVPALLCLIWGWRQGSRGMGKVMQHADTVRDWDAGRLYKLGLGAACVGTVLHTLLVERSGGFLNAYGAPHGEGFYMIGYTAYIWQGSTWVLTGIAMMMLAARKIRLSPAQYTTIALFAASFGMSSLLLGSRTGTFQTLAIMWACWSLARRSRPTIDRAAPVLALTGLAAVLIFGYRGSVYLGSNRAEAPGFADAATAGLGVSRPGACPYNTGLEFVVHSVAIETIDHTGRYDFACNLLPLYTVHVIPRIWWPSKPTLRLAEVPIDQWGPGITVRDVSGRDGGPVGEWPRYRDRGGNVYEFRLVFAYLLCVVGMVHKATADSRRVSRQSSGYVRLRHHVLTHSNDVRAGLRAGSDAYSLHDGAPLPLLLGGAP